jgi:hypothetical protein
VRKDTDLECKLRREYFAILLVSHVNAETATVNSGQHVKRKLGQALRGCYLHGVYVGKFQPVEIGHDMTLVAGIQKIPCHDAPPPWRPQPTTLGPGQRVRG